ncbi:hypothetical protein OROMI_007419 [Orobanche minor]
MDLVVDHYAVLGFVGLSDCSKLSEQEIRKAYQLKAKKMHPDKVPNDPNAHTKFVELLNSYEILKDEKTRKPFDDLLRRIKTRNKANAPARDCQDSKRRKMMSDPEQRERELSVSSVAEAREFEERISRQLILIGLLINHKWKENVGGTTGLDKRNVLKVSWEKKNMFEDYTSQRLFEIFGKFGSVEDVVIISYKNKGSALVQMASNDSADAATGYVLADDGLRVELLEPAFFSSPSKIDSPILANLLWVLGLKTMKIQCLRR